MVSCPEIPFPEAWWWKDQVPDLSISESQKLAPRSRGDSGSRGQKKGHVGVKGDSGRTAFYSSLLAWMRSPVTHCVPPRSHQKESSVRAAIVLFQFHSNIFVHISLEQLLSVLGIEPTFFTLSCTSVPSSAAFFGDKLSLNL